VTSRLCHFGLIHNEADREQFAFPGDGSSVSVAKPSIGVPPEGVGSHILDGCKQITHQHSRFSKSDLPRARIFSAG
jgi:hypothetical protein